MSSRNREYWINFFQNILSKRYEKDVILDITKCTEIFK